MDELARVARIRWAECKLPKTFRVDKVFFVQNTRRKEWLDLGESALGHPESRLVGELVDLLAGLKRSNPNRPACIQRYRGEAT